MFYLKTLLTTITFVITLNSFAGEIWYSSPKLVEKVSCSNSHCYLKIPTADSNAVCVGNEGFVYWEQNASNAKFLSQIAMAALLSNKSVNIAVDDTNCLGKRDNLTSITILK
jgi:hypothetical protein